MKFCYGFYTTYVFSFFQKSQKKIFVLEEEIPKVKNLYSNHHSATFLFYPNEWKGSPRYARRLELMMICPYLSYLTNDLVAPGRAPIVNL